MCVFIVRNTLPNSHTMLGTVPDPGWKEHRTILYSEFRVDLCSEFRIEPVLSECQHLLLLSLYFILVKCAEILGCAFCRLISIIKNTLSVWAQCHLSFHYFYLRNVSVGIIFFTLINLHLVLPRTAIDSFITQWSFKALFKMQFSKAFVGKY